MSRQQATKSRGEKGASRGVGGAQSVTVPVVTNDAVPGRVTVTLWNKLLASDEDEDLVGSVVEDILENAMEQCYKKYIWQQVVPYTVFQAKDNLLELIEWRFLSHDTGEDNVLMNHRWAEDAEPEPGIIDSWAQGSVPIIVTKSPVKEPILQPIEENLDKLEYTEDTTLDKSEILSQNIDIEIEATDRENQDEPEKRVEEETDQSYSKPVKKKIQYKKHVGRLPSAHVSDMTKTLDYTESELLEREFSSLNPLSDGTTHLSPSQKSLLKLQAGRPPGNKEVTFDERGNVIAVMRLDTKSLPSHKVKVRYSIVDPEAEAAAQRLEAMRTGKLRSLSKIHWKPKPAKMKISPRIPTTEKPLEKEKALFPAPPSPRRLGHSGKPHKQQSMVYSRIRGHVRRKGDDNDMTIEPLPPSLIDSIDASPGVTIKEGDQMKAGVSRSLAPLRNTPVPRDDGKLIGNLTISPKGARTLRMLGMSHGSNVTSGPSLTPSWVIGQHSPGISSPFSLPQPLRTCSSNSIASSS